MSLNCVRDLSECDCDCHRTKSKKHIMACCSQCPHCKRNIKRFFIGDHIKECEAERKKLEAIFKKALLDKE
ncbi:MAG: hypothetical protein R3321_11155 [Nitrososphaeraceae archaeon]|nr:hypothetical protein [Nitrososphaeraceae archaeon]